MVGTAAEQRSQPSTALSISTRDRPGVVGVGYDLVEPAFDLEIVEFESSGCGVTPGAEYGPMTCRLTLEVP